jgi:hypothetical protein
MDSRAHQHATVVQLLAKLWLACPMEQSASTSKRDAAI